MAGEAEGKTEAILEASGDTILIAAAFESIAASISELAKSVQSLADSQVVDIEQVPTKYDMGGNPV